MQSTTRKSQPTPDDIAIDIMLSDRPQAQKQKLLTALAEQVSVAVHRTYPCPACSSTAPKEDNGLAPTDFDYSERCPDCGEECSPNV